MVKVFLGFAQPQLPLPFIDSAPELMLQTAITLLEQPQISAWAIGCGLGLSPDSEQLLTTVLAQRNEKIPYVFDADALVLLAQLNLSHINTKLTANCVLTPHIRKNATFTSL